ncbi:YccS family putative transporter [Zobellella maritima]|uniref:YccS family putative transporter n=1 Tax=Zobellella maritima TaxID=2059725 RepID=UPI000E300818|nr:YccS family putative transporter [Zobellella maritima]
MSSLLPWLRRLFTDSHFFFALKVLLALSCLLFFGWLADEIQIAVTLALGAMAAALSEVDQAPWGRFRHLLVSLGSFFIATILVNLFIDQPLIFGPLLIAGTFMLILIGAAGASARALGFGTLLVSLYAMQGHLHSPHFWYQPLLLTAGAVWYGLISWLVLLAWPYKQVHEQLAQCYFALSRYLLEKARFFDAPEQEHQQLRHQLAQLNIQLVTALDNTKQMLNRRLQGSEPQDEELSRLLALYLLVMDMHERATSSHYSYQQLKVELEQSQVVAGYQTAQCELGEACYRLGYAILTHSRYRHDKRLAWVLSALGDQLAYSHLQRHYPRSLLSPMKFLARNMRHLHQALLRAERLTQPHHPAVLDYSSDAIELARPEQPPFWDRLKTLLHPNAILFRHSVRISLCFALGYGLITSLGLEQGYWILLTILFVCQPSFSATRQRLVQRTLGTLGGILVAMPLLTFFPSVGAQLIIMLLSIFVFFTQVRTHYSWAVCFMTLFVLLAFSLLAGSEEQVFLPRLLDTLAGCLLAFIAVWFIWPDWQQRYLPRLMADAMDANADYLAAIIDQFAHGRNEQLNYRIARKRAHQADNQLALTWQNIRVEPVPRHWLNLCFDIAYRNHTLLSYLSTLGSHRKHADVLQDAQVLVERLQAAAQALRNGRELAAFTPLLQTPDATDDEWEILTQQLLGNITQLVNDLYLLSRGFQQQGSLPHTTATGKIGPQQ